MHVCLNNEKGGQDCAWYSDEDYAKYAAAQNAANQGITRLRQMIRMEATRAHIYVRRRRVWNGHVRRSPIVRRRSTIW